MSRRTFRAVRRRPAPGLARAGRHRRPVPVRPRPQAGLAARACRRRASGELAALRDAKPAFEKAWDHWDTDRDDTAALERYREARDAWVDVVLRDVLGWKDSYRRPRAAADVEVHSPDYSVTVTPDRRAGARRH